FGSTQDEKRFRQRIISIVSIADLGSMVLHPSDIICPVQHSNTKFSLLGEALRPNDLLVGDLPSRDSIRFLLIR
ncbi:MAG: hypothetical protein M0Q92_16295, partial [Methanoregula sp.]|nr:hypothetical protein [Methanoregula sp.]